MRFVKKSLAVDVVPCCLGCPRAICCHGSSRSTFSMLVSVSRSSLTFMLGFGYPASASGNQGLLCHFSLKISVFP